MAGLRDPYPAYLLCWELIEVTGEWWCWLTWIRERRGSPYRHVACVPAGSVQPIEQPEAYRAVPRRVRGRNGVIQPWRPGAARNRLSGRG